MSICTQNHPPFHEYRFILFPLKYRNWGTHVGLSHGCARCLSDGLIHFLCTYTLGSWAVASYLNWKNNFRLLVWSTTDKRLPGEGRHVFVNDIVGYCCFSSAAWGFASFTVLSCDTPLVRANSLFQVVCMLMTQVHVHVLLLQVWALEFPDGRRITAYLAGYTPCSWTTRAA